LAKDEDSLLAEAELSIAMKRTAVQKLQDQLKKKVTLEEEGLTCRFTEITCI